MPLAIYQPDDDYVDLCDDPDVTFAIQAHLARAINLAGRAAWSAEIEDDQEGQAFFEKLAGELAGSSNEVMRFRGCHFG
jgi:hypothetical protein